MRLHHLIAIALATLALTACGDDSAPMEDQDDGDMPYEEIKCPDELPELVIGAKAMGAMELIEGELLDADQIPAGWFHNDWIVRFTAADGEPLEDVEMTSAKTWMPAHGHSGGQTPTIEQLDDGEFDVDGLNITMNGPWQFIFKISATNAGGEPITDTVTFDVCNSQPKPKSE